MPTYTKEDIKFDNVLYGKTTSGAEGPRTNFSTKMTTEQLEAEGYGKEGYEISREVAANDPNIANVIFTTNAIDIHWGGAKLPDVPSGFDKIYTTAQMLLALNESVKISNQVSTKLLQLQQNIEEQLSNMNKQFTQLVNGVMTISTACDDSK